VHLFRITVLRYYGDSALIWAIGTEVRARAPRIDQVPCFADLLALNPDEAAFERLRQAESIGRPLGDESFLTEIEERDKAHSSTRQTRAEAETRGGRQVKVN
jgi:hypothetical protein